MVITLNYTLHALHSAILQMWSNIRNWNIYSLSKIHLYCARWSICHIFAAWNVLGRMRKRVKRIDRGASSHLWFLALSDFAYFYDILKKWFDFWILQFIHCENHQFPVYPNSSAHLAYVQNEGVSACTQSTRFKNACNCSNDFKHWNAM